MWDKMPLELGHELRKFLGDLRDEQGLFHHGSLYSGTGIDSLVMKLGLIGPGKERLGVDVRPVLQYCCDIGEEQKTFLLEAHPEMLYLFNDVKEMGNLMAFDHKSQKEVIIPFVHFLTWGCICKSWSKNNNKAKDFRQCVQKGT